MATINSLFREISAYDTTEIPDATLNEYYIPMAKEYYCRMCQITFSLVLTAGEYSSSDTENPELEYIHNTIIAELASSRADAKMNTINIDPEHGMERDLHYIRAFDLMKDNFGVLDKTTGMLVLPFHLASHSGVTGGFVDSAY